MRWSNISNNKKTLLIGALMIGVLFFVPLVDSFSFGDVFSDVGTFITGFFHMITGMDTLSACELGGGVCIDECLGNWRPVDNSCSRDTNDILQDDDGEGGSNLAGLAIKDLTGMVGVGTQCCVENICGDSVVWGSEECDLYDLDGETCITRGYSEGELDCKADCTFDESGCIMNSYCGDNEVNQDWEQCDGNDMPATMCVELGDSYVSGVLDCYRPGNANGCQYDISDCMLGITGTCNNNEVCEEGEECGNCWEDCNGYQADCLDGYVCEYGECVAGAPELPECGDEVVNQDDEECDGPDLNDETCESLGYACGTLTCIPSSLDEGCTFNDELDCDYEADCIEFDDPESNDNVIGGNSNSNSNSNSYNPTTCANVEGYCTDVCAGNEVAYSDNNLDVTCAQSYDTAVPLICCVPQDSDAAVSQTNNGNSGDDDSEGEGDSLTKNLEDYLNKKQTQKGSNGEEYSPSFVSNIERLFGDAGYGVGAVWVVFGLLVVVVAITFFLHRKFHKGKK